MSSHQNNRDTKDNGETGTVKVEFDPTDPKYQVSDKFKPDKASGWKIPIEDDGWIHAHNALRWELTKFIEAVETLAGRKQTSSSVHHGPTSLQDWEVKNLQTAWKTHCEHTHAHHENEDDLLVPFLQTRFHYPDKCMTDHDGLIHAMDEITIMIDERLVGEIVPKEGKERQDDKTASTKSVVQELLLKLKSYQTAMLAHLKEEEDMCLPLTRAYFTEREVATKIQSIIAKGPKVEMGSFICAMGIDEFRTKFMVQNGIPFFVWYIDFKSRVKLFQRQFLDPLEEITVGSVNKSNEDNGFAWSKFCTIQ